MGRVGAPLLPVSFNRDSDLRAQVARGRAALELAPAVCDGCGLAPCGWAWKRDQIWARRPNTQKPPVGTGGFCDTARVLGTVIRKTFHTPDNVTSSSPLRGGTG